MQFKCILLLLLTVASGTSIHASTMAVKRFGDRDVGIGGAGTLVARITPGTSTPLTRTTVTKTVTSSISATTTPSGDTCIWCDCLSALADEGVACAAAALEEGCNIVQDISCAIDTAIAIRQCHACLRF
ncbi:hypothetical protein MVEN_02565800 [Mycena venus]|uniref:Fungal calcium binding protein domain-containing protein n=1 Tax=Mycena venus TaxID=2733690 RepID=A0A8H6WRI3_9AGAR|nr:hypothetical protein MVEN_02565800 [Mycena venus]